MLKNKNQTTADLVFDIINARQRANLNQQDLATKCGVSIQYVSMIESGKKEPSVQFLKNSASILGLSVDKIKKILLKKEEARLNDIFSV